MTKSLPSLLRSALAGLLLAACGGGVETGGTGAGAYVEAPVSGFGSVIAGGVRFEVATAHIEDAEGQGLDAAALQLGMRIEVEAGAIGHDADGARSAAAQRVRVAAELLGPVSGFVGTSPFIEVLGQAVRVTAATVVGGVPGGLPALTVGDIVEVHGFPEAGGGSDRYVATRIERRDAATPAFRVRGLVRSLDAVARTLRIGQQQYDLGTTGVPAGLANGQMVRLVVGTTPVHGRWPVLSIRSEPRRLADRDEAEVEGVVTALASPTHFEVNGIEVHARDAAFVDGNVALGARVRVRGRAEAGALFAGRVELRSDQEAYEEGFDLRDAVTALDPLAQTFALRGMPVFYGSVPPPRFDNGSAADLAAGRRVRVVGLLSADRTRVVASRIEFVNN
ncbi:MAG TPA: DUF5666 domain-containing protein [Burkholderiaceae bacterium]|nr:DUF5666 domain-containing protein [Burkholderiaceae bacterium]